MGVSWWFGGRRSGLSWGCAVDLRSSPAPAGFVPWGCSPWFGSAVSAAGLLRPRCSVRLAARCRPAAWYPLAGRPGWLPWRAGAPSRSGARSPASGAVPPAVGSARRPPPGAAGPSVGACWRSVWGCAAAPPPRSPRWLASRRFARGCAVVASLTPSHPAPPLSSPSRVGPCRRCWCALVALAPLGCWSPASSPCRRPRPSPAAPPSGRVAPWRSALAWGRGGRMVGVVPGVLVVVAWPRWRGSPAACGGWGPRLVRRPGARWGA